MFRQCWPLMGAGVAVFMYQVIFATVFERSPVGAAYPNGQVISGHALPAGFLTAAEAAALQRIAAKVVLDEDGRLRSEWRRRS